MQSEADEIPYSWRKNVHMWLTEGRCAGKCGSDLQSSDLIFPVLKFCQHPTISVSLKHWEGISEAVCIYLHCIGQCLKSLYRSRLSLQSHPVGAHSLISSAAGGIHNNLLWAQFGCTGQCQASHLSRGWPGHIQHRQWSFLSLCRPDGDMTSQISSSKFQSFFAFFCCRAFFGELSYKSHHEI